MHAIDVGTRIDLRIDSLAAGGDGIGRGSDGRVIFVPFAAPGDLVRIRITESHRRFARGQVEELLEPSPNRTDPLCAVFGSCGGCTWQHIDYPTQLDAKRAILRDALQRIGGIPIGEDVPIQASPRPYAYRGRTRVLAVDGRVGYRRRRSHALCATSRCPVLVPQLDAELTKLSERKPSGRGEWELVAGSDGRARSTPLARPLTRRPTVCLDVRGDSIRVSPGAFVQANALLLDELAAGVHEAAGKGGLGVELFSGSGFFTVGLARRFGQLVAIESEGRAVADLVRNLRQAGLENVEVRRGRVERIFSRPPLSSSRPDVVVLDPPRVGIWPETLTALVGLAPRRIVYLSCDPATLARDLAGFIHGGYSLTGVQAFDLFPQTPHVEALAVVEAE